MKTKIEHNSNSSLKGMVVGAYMHHSTGYILLNNNKVYSLHAETSEEEDAVKGFIEQLQIGGYVFVYATENRIIRVYDMVSRLTVDAEPEDALEGNEQPFYGLLHYKTKEILPDGVEVFIFGVKSISETKGFCLAVSPVRQPEVYRQMVMLQANDAVSVKLTPKGIPGWIKDHTRKFEFTV